MFRNVASSYDVMNDLMSLGVHRLWKDRFIKVLNPAPDTKLLDVAGGTGMLLYHMWCVYLLGVQEVFKKNKW